MQYFEKQELRRTLELRAATVASHFFQKINLRREGVVKEDAKSKTSFNYFYFLRRYRLEQKNTLRTKRQQRGR